MNKPKFLRTVQLNEIRKRRKRRPTCISLFSGCGGFDVGFHQAGFETRVMVEWMKDACATLRANFTVAGYRETHPKSRGKPPLLRGCSREPAIMCVDITKTPTSEILAAGGLEPGEADALTGGFPCQGFSMAGLRNPKDPRNALYRECVRVIREALPKTFVLENVKGLISMEGGMVIRTICDQLADVGYDVTWKLIDCADYGVPQHRERVIFMGKRRDVLLANGPNGRPALFMGHGRGEVRHQDGFEKKYPLQT